MLACPPWEESIEIVRLEAATLRPRIDERGTPNRARLERVLRPAAARKRIEVVFWGAHRDRVAHRPLTRMLGLEHAEPAAEHERHVDVLLGGPVGELSHQFFFIDAAAAALKRVHHLVGRADLVALVLLHALAGQLVQPGALLARRD